MEKEKYKEKYKEILKAIMLLYKEKISTDYGHLSEIRNLYIRIKEETGVDYDQLNKYIQTMWQKYGENKEDER